MKAIVIIGSMRPVRVGDQIAGVVDRIRSERGVDTKVVDLSELNLPPLNEPQVPATGQYAREHTRNWAATVSGADAVVVVTPQDNDGDPSGPKTAINSLYNEWQGRLGAIISYGGRGGGMVYDQFAQVLSLVGPQLDPEGEKLFQSRDDYGENGTFTDAEAAVGAQAAEIAALVDRVIAAMSEKDGAQG